MKKKLIKFGTSYGIIIPSTLLELMDADMKNIGKTYVEIDFDSNTKTILINNPKIVEEE